MLQEEFVNADKRVDEKIQKFQIVVNDLRLDIDRNTERFRDFTRVVKENIYDSCQKIAKKLIRED